MKASLDFIQVIFMKKTHDQTMHEQVDVLSIHSKVTVDLLELVVIG